MFNKNNFELIRCLERAKFNLLFNIRHLETYDCEIIVNKDIDLDEFLNYLNNYFSSISSHIINTIEKDEIVYNPSYYKVSIQKDIVSFDGALALCINLVNVWRNNTDYYIEINKNKDFIK